MSATSANSGRILVVEDDRALCALLDEELTDAGFDTRVTGSAEQALPLVARWDPHLVLSDLRLPGADGLTLLERSRSANTAPAFVMITAFGTIDQAVDALKRGADDFLTKPLDLDELLQCVARVMQAHHVSRAVSHDDTGGEFHGIVGTSVAMNKVFGQIRRVGATQGSVLVVGESGSGKELVARAIHTESRRAAGPFVAVNCAGIPSELLESEFFGHVAGAFTGARKGHTGLFAQADGGTLMLDEIAEMPLALQAKLLRVLQDGLVRPVGSGHSQAVDVRIIACTNRDLDTEIRAGRFREDLYYRLETFTVRVPPLRERRQDIATLTARFMARHANSGQATVQGIDDAALERLRCYDFPGNVRELQNIIERALAFCDHATLQVRDLPERVQSATAAPSDDRAPSVEPRWMDEADGILPTLSQVETRYIRYVLDRVGGNKRRAAALLGIGRRTLYRRLDDDAPS